MAGGKRDEADVVDRVPAGYVLDAWCSVDPWPNGRAAFILEISLASADGPVTILLTRGMAPDVAAAKLEAAAKQLLHQSRIAQDRYVQGEGRARSKRR